MNRFAGFRIELRRSPAVTALPLVVAVASFTAFAKVPAGDTTWPDAQAALGIALILVGPCLTALAVVSGARERRHRTAHQRLLSARSISAVVGAEVAAIAVWSTVGFGLAMAAVGVRTALHVHGGSPSASIAISQLAAIVLFSVTGFVVGRATGYRLAIPLAGLAAFGAVQALNFFAFFNPSWMSALNPGRNYHADIWHDVDVATGLGRAVWFLGLATMAVGIVCLAARRDSAGRSAPLTVAVGLFAAVCGATAVWIQGGRVYADNIRSTIALKCVEGPTRVCVNPVHADVLPQLESSFDALRTRVAGTAMSFQTASEVQFSSAQPIGAPDLAFVIPQTDSGYIQRVLGQSLAERWLAVCVPQPGGSQDASPTSTALQAEIVGWLAGQPQDAPVADPTAVAAIRDFRSMDEQTKRQWLKEHDAAIARCALTPADFG